MKTLAKKVIIFIISFVIISIALNLIFEEILNLGNIMLISLVSGNMEPTYSRGDILFISFTPSQNYQINEVVLFSEIDVSGFATGNEFVTRIIDINEDATYEMKGDANKVQLPTEQKVSKEEIIGKSIFSTNVLIFNGIKYGIVIIFAILVTRLFVREKHKEPI